MIHDRNGHFFETASWPKPILNRLIELCADKHLYSASDIARVLNQEFPDRVCNFTRNAIIGKIQRRNIPWTRSLGKRDAAQAVGATAQRVNVQHGNSPSTRLFSGKNVNYDPRRKEKNSINKITQKSPKFNPVNGVVGDALFAGFGIPRLTARDNQCSWPLGKCPIEGHLICGKPTVEKFSYCMGHMTIGYKTIPARRSIWSEIPSVERVG